MKIAIDLTSLMERATGVDRSLFGLATHLARLDTDHEFALFINEEDRDKFGRPDASGRASAFPDNFRVWPSSTRSRAVRLFFQQARLPGRLRADGTDVLHSPSFIMPLCRGRRSDVLTIHDMSSYLTPSCHPLYRRGAAYEWAVTTSIRRAHAVTVPSPAVKQDILQLVPGIDERRLHVVPHGIDDTFRPQSPGDVDRTLRRLGVAAPYVLFVGTLDPRKNLTTLVDAFARLAAAGRPERLVLAGQPGWSMAPLLARIEQARLADRVMLIGYVAEADLPRLYAGARLFVYPSLLEGFGFPPLEAMATGVPVVASCTSSLRDYLNGAASLVPPDDANGLAAAMEHLLADEDARQAAIAAGISCAARFGWDACARRTVRCYEEARLERERER
jgi:alpha-1,3-rhamnosyl/mannosyltransferase